MTIKVTIWNEGRHEQLHKEVQEIYPDRIDGAIASGIAHPDFEIRRGTLDDPDEGLPDSVLDDTDVLLWWGHMAHEEVSDGLIGRVQQRVLKGMGLLVLHSGHHSKLFRRLMGTNANLSWRETPEGDLERVWVVNPSHPIAEGLPPYFEVNASEMYGEPFDIPQPDELVFISWYSGGEVFRSGCTFQRGRGRIFFFSPGHETYPIYHDKTVHKVISNGVRWAKQKHTDGRILENWHRAEPLHGRPDKVKA
ncbi:trehalose utilization protein ThuA [Rhizobium leguminosarum]|uniref:ThuA domain-containing protein n=1 Tax=Rhizobium leguminosarum TaxID=384 RepID=UPI001C94ACB0|nr:ThuA domain-containing protein [Rhizobium leguminosarum]MBY5704248.1 trehalose utilization protein ThuA [Rhizobium leguminosarum]